MNKLTAIIVDDEQDSITTLKWELENFADKITVINSFQDPIKAIAAIKKEQPNILFLDIQMPQINGFDLLKKVQGNFDSIIFITAFDEFAIKAFNVSAIDYILKPIETDSLKKCITKLEKFYSKNSLQNQFELLFAKLHKNKNLDKIALPTTEGLEFVKPSQILYCKSDNNYTTVFMQNNKKIVVSKTLKEIENNLENQQFFRVHHSYLINLNFLDKYYRGKSAYIILENGTQIPVSRNRKNDFLDKL